MNERFKIEVSEKFEEGEFRQVTQFMQPENLENIKFKFTGRSKQYWIESLLLRLFMRKMESTW